LKAARDGVSDAVPLLVVAAVDTVEQERPAARPDPLNAGRRIAAIKARGLEHLFRLVACQLPTQAALGGIMLIAPKEDAEAGLAWREERLPRAQDLPHPFHPLRALADPATLNGVALQVTGPDLDDAAALAPAQPKRYGPPSVHLRAPARSITWSRPKVLPARSDQQPVVSQHGHLFLTSWRRRLEVEITSVCPSGHWHSHSRDGPGGPQGRLQSST